MGTIKPNKALQAMAQGNKEAQAQYEQLGNDARMLVNIWASSSPEVQREYLQFMENERKKRAENAAKEG